jgi:hypothetical protein
MVSEINTELTEVKNTCCYGESQKTKIKHINKPATRIYLHQHSDPLPTFTRITYVSCSFLPRERKNKIKLSKEPTLKTAINKNLHQHVSIPITQYGQDTDIGIDTIPAFVFRKIFQIQLKYSSIFFHINMDQFE